VRKTCNLEVCCCLQAPRSNKNVSNNTKQLNNGSVIFEEGEAAIKKNSNNLQ
jgi:hypothetical protein